MSVCVSDNDDKRLFVCACVCVILRALSALLLLETGEKDKIPPRTKSPNRISPSIRRT